MSGGIWIRPCGGGMVYRADLPSWWRANDRRFWRVHSCFWGMVTAVVDDFGDLVAVPA